MATLELEDRERIDEIKSWWKIYGNRITNVLLAIAVAAALWSVYNWYSKKQSAAASQAYYTLLRHVASKDLAKSKALYSELVEKFPSTNYAKFASMLVAKLHFTSGDNKTAKEQLQWVVDNGSSELRDIARLNLVAILIDENAFDLANKELSATHEEAANARFANLQGDIALLQNKNSEAKTHFTKALQAIESSEKSVAKKSDKVADIASPDKSSDNSLLKILLKQKLDALGDN